MKKTLITDNEFVINLFISQSDSSIHEDLFNFLTSDFSSYHLVCDFVDEEAYKQALLENPIWEMIFDKFDTIEYNSELNIDEICERKDINHSIFLLNKSEDECNTYSDKYGYIFVSNTNIEKKWDFYSKFREGVRLKVTNDNSFPADLKLDSWSKLDEYFININSIIIFDKYILTDKANQKIEKNLLELLNVITKKNRLLESIDITIITEHPNNNFTFCIKKLQKDLLLKLYNKTKLKKINLNIIKYSKAIFLKNIDGIHSRYILTNYHHIRSDDSFNFFKNNGKVNNDVEIRINFNLTNKNSLFYAKDLNDLKQYINKVKNEPNSGKKDLNVMYFPNKENKLLN